MSDNNEHGTWVKVTKPSEVKVGDRVRYVCDRHYRFGFGDGYREIVSVSPTVVTSGRTTLFVEADDIKVEVFRADTAKPPKRKVARSAIRL
jgi:hypothetical protein